MNVYYAQWHCCITKTNFSLIRKMILSWYIYKCTPYRPITGTRVVEGQETGRINTCIVLNQRNNYTWQFLFAEYSKGWRLCTVQRTHSTDIAVAVCLWGLLESGLILEFCITKVLVVGLCKKISTFLISCLEINFMLFRYILHNIFACIFIVNYFCQSSNDNFV